MRLSFNGSYPVTRVFGIYDAAYANYPGSKHSGTDFGLPAYTPLVAGLSGTVMVFDRPASIKTGRGKEVSIMNGGRIRRTCHMNRIDVVSGQWVNEGDPIGLSGYTGYVVDSKGQVGTPGGAHLHDEYLENGIYMNLMSNLKEENVSLSNPQLIEIHYLMFEGKEPGPGFIDGLKGLNLDQVLNKLKKDPTYLQYKQQVLASLNSDAQAKLEQIKKIVG